MYKENPNVLIVDRAYEAYYKVHPFQKNTHTQNYKHWRRAVDRYVQEDGQLNIRTAKEQFENQEQVQRKRAQLQLKQQGTWRPLGPYETYNNEGQMPVSWQANVYTIDQSRSNPNIVYAGTEAGGIFKSEDKGQSWSMVSHTTNMRTISTIKVDPQNQDIAYAADRDAIYRTLDGGSSWTISHLVYGISFTDLAINPQNGQIVFAAGDDALYRTLDGGENWERILSERIWDIEFQPGNASTVMVLRSNEADERTEFWKSTDNGDNFSIKETGWYTSSDPSRREAGGRMTVTEADPNRIYVILIGNSKAEDFGYIGVYRSSDGGESWSLTDPPMGAPYDDDHNNLATLNNTNTLQQGYYNLGIAASDVDPDVLLVGCLNLWRSDDAGASFTPLGGYRGDIRYIHPDQQEIEINGTDMWLANDGGINYSTDYFDTHESRIKGLNASDFWGFGSGWNENLIVGGRYHNGNTAHRPGFGEGNYLRLGGAEAATGYVQPGGESIAHFSDIQAKVIPASMTEAVVNAGRFSMFPNESYFASNYSELEFDPNCYTHMWIGRDNKLYRSEDNGGTFELVKAFGGEDDPVHNIEISRVDNKVIYVYQRTSFYGAVLWVTRDGGETWMERNFPNADSQRSGSLAIHSSAPGSLWVTFSHQNNDGNKIFRTDDYGETWTNITTAALDGETIHCSFHQAGTDNIFIGTDYAIYQYDGQSWIDCSAGLPQRFVTNRFQPFYKENKLRIASYGNGVWEMDLPGGAVPIAQPTVDKRVANCSRDTFFLDDYSVVEHDAQLTYNWEFSPPPSFISDPSARNPKVVFEGEGSYDLALTVSNANGSDVFTMEDYLRVEASVCEPDIFPGLSMKCFSTGGDYVQIPDMNLTLPSFTMTAWVKPNGVQPDYTGIYFNDEDSYGMNFTVGNQLGFHHQGAGSAAWGWQSGAVVPSDEWSYVALVVEPNKATVYLNGIPYVRELTLEPAVLRAMKIGSYKGWSSRNFNGEIDEVTLWDRALSTTELRAQRHITKNKDNAPGLIAYYQFNSAGRIFDLISDNHGVMRGWAMLETSYAPVGGGTASVWSMTNDPSYMFINENLLLDGDALNGEIAVSHLGIAPQNIDLTDPFPIDQYWILNQYGPTVIDNLHIRNTTIEPQFESMPGDVLLFSRSENDSESGFLEIGGSESVISGINSSVSYLVQEDFEGQFLMNKAMVSNTKNISEEDKIFPNPTSSELNVDIGGEDFEISFYDAKGQRVLLGKISGGGKVNLSQDLPVGSYSYLIETKERLITGQVVVQQQ